VPGSLTALLEIIRKIHLRCLIVDCAPNLRVEVRQLTLDRDAPGQAIHRQLRHKKFDTIMKYIRVGQLYKNAAGMAGL
jgi:hypothetical protein